MFNLLPQDIIKNIYEFDATYKEEYNKSLEILENLPVYDHFADPTKFRKKIFPIYTYHIQKVNILTISINPPSKCYFNILNDLKMISIYARSRVNYNKMIIEFKQKIKIEL